MPNGMLNPGSYFPPVDSWTSRLPSPAIPAPAPLLPTPIPTALPSTLGGTLNELPPHVDENQDILLPPAITCSCPMTDACIAESLALLFGSFTLLHRVATQLEESGLSSFLDTSERKAARDIKIALAKFEKTIRKLFAPVSIKGPLDISDILLEQWLRPPRPTLAEDVCATIRRTLDSLMIEVVDTFPPIQHNLHMLLVRYEFGSPRLQSMLESLVTKATDSSTRLLLEANRQLAQFSVKSDSLQKQKLVDELQMKVDDLVRIVDAYDLDVISDKHKC